MCPYDQQIAVLTDKIAKMFGPKYLFLFGSCAGGVITKHSDIDLCLIKNTENKRKLVQEILLAVTDDINLDIIVYTEKEWAKYKDDPATLAYTIAHKGESLIG